MIFKVTMYALNPNQRKRQKMVLQLNNSRATRQIETKNTRQTLNSKNKPLFNIDRDPLLKKKQKIHQGNNTTSKHYDKNEMNDEEVDADALRSSENDKENSDNNSGIYNSDDDDLKSSSNIIQKVNDNNSITEEYLGVGHTGLLHAHVRDTLFKNIKFLAPNHLETSGEIIQTVLKLLKYSESKNGNLTAFVNSCRMEIRKTMCSRRGYVKRQTGLTLKGMNCTILFQLTFFFTGLLKKSFFAFRNDER